MMSAYNKGLRAEKLAIVILRCKGYKILAKRFNSPVGEIDLIAQRNNRLILIEVKTRSSQDKALNAISYRQQQRIIRATNFYLMKHPKWANREIQFDVIAFWPWKWCHLKNVW